MGKKYYWVEVLFTHDQGSVEFRVTSKAWERMMRDWIKDREEIIFVETFDGYTGFERKHVLAITSHERMQNDGN